ncbi:MAG: carboxymuconolactone decarboxylase family protein [Gammaproteobacteria bacterium]|nr:carboxymuconolactone decarboxylase family protein [Gammaproteobacteria bacterium]
MSRISPLHPDDLPSEQKAAVQEAEELLGFVANDALIMARNPPLADAVGGLVRAVYAPGSVDPGFKRLIGLVTSAAAGCRYCMGHTAFTSQRHGIDEDKLAAVWGFEQSPLFSESEKAALRLALLAGQTPNGVTDESWAELAEHFDEAAQLEIVAVIAMFGFLNRWNSTLATDLEAQPQAALDTAQPTA